MRPDEEKTNVTPFPPTAGAGDDAVRDGLRLMRAFQKIANAADRQKVIAVAEELSGPGSDASA